MERLLVVCLAGALGTGARYVVGIWAARRFGTAFPAGTLMVNLAGCFLMAVVVQAGASLAWSPTVRSALTIGFLGGLTTYASFNYDTTFLLQGGATGPALLNVATTLFGGLAAGWLGLVVARQVFGS